MEKAPAPSDGETIEDHVIEYYEATEGQQKITKGSGENTSSVKRLVNPKMEKRPQIYTCYVKEEPRIVEEDAPNATAASRIMPDTIDPEPFASNSTMPVTFIPEAYISETFVSEMVPPDPSDTDVPLEPRRRGRPKKKPLSVLTPMEISNNHDQRSSEETLETVSEHLYAGLLGRTRRTTRMNMDEIDGNGLSEESEPERDDDFTGRKGRPYGSVKNRGRGRGRARSRGTGSRRGRGRRRRSSGKGEIEDNFSNLDIAQGHGIEEMEEHNFGETESSAYCTPKVLPNVKCGKCGEEFLRKEWSRHNLLRHNDTAWLDGQPPIVDYDTDEKLFKKVLMIALKKRKGQLSCEQCGIIKRSVVGFLSHTRFCGKTESERKELMVQCPKCNSSVKPCSMYTHERNCQREKETVPQDTERNSEQEEIPELDISQGKSKRRAAEKAVSRISEFTTAVRANMEEVTPHTVKYFIQKPHLERKIGGSVRNAFYNELDITGKASCRQPGCNFFGTSLEAICEHYTKCNFEVQEHYICKVCNFHSLIGKEIMDHVLEKHSTADTSDNYADPDHPYQVKSEESSEASDCEPETTRTRFASRLRFFPNQPDEKLRAFRAEFLEIEPFQNPKKNIPYAAAYRWTLNFELNNYQLVMFKDLLPNEFILLSREESEEFLPELRKSMAMRRKVSRISSFGFPEMQNEWCHWERFEGQVEEDVPTFFVGGPVWALAWLPIPLPMHSYHPIQYLAVSTHPTMESEYLIGQAYSGKNVIQIWNVGNLHQKTDTSFIPKISYAVAHDGGTIWCMEWCPSGTYQDERIAKFEQEPHKAKRMGLLAAACSDGFVRIYSFPFPDELQNSEKDMNQFPVFKSNPVQLLVVNIGLIEKENQTWQCTKLSWTKESGHNILAAGFSNGYIALWNLATQSSLLRKKQGNTTLLNSFRHFYAHNHSVTMISMIPYGGNRFLVSAGLDRCYKVWDLDQLNCVECITTRGLAVDGSWMNNWPCSVLSYDDALGLSHTNSQLIPLREHSYKYFPVLATNSATYAISVSDYANAIAQGNQAGEILAIFPHQILYKDIENYLNKKRWLCSFVQVTDFKSPENREEDQNKNDKKEYCYKPVTYSECAERFGISFSDDFKSFRTCREKQLKEKIMPTDQLETVSIEQYPFASVNRISWNPNAWSYLWFAAGYQNGFIRILNFNSTVSADQLTKFLPRFSTQMVEKHNELNENS